MVETPWALALARLGFKSLLCQFPWTSSLTALAVVSLVNSNDDEIYPARSWEDCVIKLTKNLAQGQTHSWHSIPFMARGWTLEIPGMWVVVGKRTALH